MQNNHISVAIQGEKASFHEIAAIQYYKQPTKLLYCDSFEEVFRLLMTGEAERAFVAVSNSNHGDIDEVKRLLEATQPIEEGEYLLPIEQHLIGLAGADAGCVKRVISHPVALSQCSNSLASRFAHAELQQYHDTSAVVAYIKQLSDPSIAAIGSARAAELYGLTVLQPSIQDDTDNATLFKSFIKAS